MNVGYCRLCKSVGDTRNLGEIFTKLESTTSGRGRGAFIWRSTSTGHIYFVVRASEEPNNFRVVKSKISESQVSFELKVKLKRYVKRGVVLRAAYAKKFEGQERIKRDRKCVWKPQSPQTKFRINAINSYKKVILFLYCNDFFERVFFSH